MRRRSGCSREARAPLTELAHPESARPESAQTGSNRRRGLVLALLVLAAFVVGLAGLLLHRWRVEVSPDPVLRLPAGLLLALAAGAVLLVRGRRIGAGRGGLGLVAAAWLAPVVLGAITRPEGDLLLVADGYGIALLVGSAVLLAAAFAVPFPDPRPTRASSVRD